MVGESQTAPYNHTGSLKSASMCVCEFAEDLVMTKDVSRILNVKNSLSFHLQSSCLCGTNVIIIGYLPLVKDVLLGWEAVALVRGPTNNVAFLEFKAMLNYS